MKHNIDVDSDDKNDTACRGTRGVCCIPNQLVAKFIDSSKS